jgi:hypothetical protein
MTTKKDLLELNRNIKALGRKMDMLLKAIESGEDSNASKGSTSTAVKPKARKGAAAKKAPAKKNAVPLTDTDKVLRIINRSRKGIDTASLMKKTEFNQKKIRNILHRAYKAGKIKRVAKGLYLGAKAS